LDRFTLDTVYIPEEAGKEFTVNGNIEYVKNENGKIIFNATSGSFQLKAN